MRSGAPLRVLHVIDTLARAGAEQCLVAGLPHLRQFGVEPTVLAWKQPFTLASEFEKHGVRVRPPRDLRPGVVAGYDVLHTHLQLSTLLGRTLALPSCRPVVTSLHGLDYSTTGYGRWRLRWYADRLTNYLSPSTFVAVSEAVRRDYARHLFVPSVVIDNPVDVSWVEGLPSPAEARARLGLRVDERVALMVANYRWIKGHDVLARAAARCPDVTFVVAGRVSEAHRQELGPRLRWLGSLERSELRWWLAAADVGVSPSRGESFGLAAVEMLAGGLQLVVSDIPGLGDTVGSLARKVPAGEPDALASAVEQAFRGRDGRAERAARGLERARLFSPERWAERMANLYKNL